METGSKIFIAGATGLLGSALIRKLSQRRYRLIAPSKSELNLLDGYSVKRFFDNACPNYVFLAAAKVGNIFANISQPTEFLSENLAIQQNVITNAHSFGVKKLIFFASNCCYPRLCIQPMREGHLMSGPLEETNRAYAIAKLAGIEMCRSYNKQYGTNFIVAIPAGMYGEKDNFDSGRAHVLADLIKKFHGAMISGRQEVVLFGDGLPRREFIYVDDVAEASIFLVDNFNPSKEEIGSGDILVNVGTGVDYSIADLADMVRHVVGYTGRIHWDLSGPRGMPRKLLDSKRCRDMGWEPKTRIQDGIKRAYRWYIENIDLI